MGLTDLPDYEFQYTHASESKQASTVAAAAVMMVLSVLAVAGRLVAHRMVQPNFLVDDYCAIAAMFISLGLCGTLIACVHYGLAFQSCVQGALQYRMPLILLAAQGLHVVAVELDDPDPPQDLVNVFKTGYSMTVIAIPDLFFIKLSLLFFYKRIFAAPSPKFKYTLYGIIAYVVCWTIGALVVFIYQCDPIEFFWFRSYALAGLDPPVKGSCLPSVSHQVAPAVLNSISDLLILLIPGVALWPLQMRNTKKIGLFFVFSLGAFVCGVSIIKIVSAFAVSNDSDSTYVNTELLLWTVVECCIGLVCACLPCMVPLCRIFTRGPKAAFRSPPQQQQHRPANNAASIVRMHNLNSPRFPGGRRLHSSEDLDDGTLTGSDKTQKSRASAKDQERGDDYVPVGGDIIPWDSQGMLKSKIRNEAVGGGYSAQAAKDLPPNSIQVENTTEMRSERGDVE